MVKENEEIIVGLNQQQLMKGEFPSGQKTPPYTPSTFKRKEENPRAGLYGDGVHYSLRNETDLYPQMYVEVKNDFIEIKSGSYSSFLFDIWVRQVKRLKLSQFFGLNVKNEKEVKEVLSKQTQNGLNKFFNGL